MLCVNLNSPEFKQQAARNNVSENNLELIIHKYRMQTNQEDAIPDDVYVQEQLGNVMYQESSDNVIKLWRQDYNHPLEYKTMEELNEARDKASQFFPESSVIHYVDNNGNYVLNVKEPVKDLSAQNTSHRYSQEMWNIKQRTIADGTFMKAPNGQPTNLSERQWLHVRTRAFKDWFGDWENDRVNASKVVDENGEPMVVYHGTLSEFNVFDFNRLGETTGQGYYVDHITGEQIPIDSSYAFFFTDNKIAARSYKNLAIWQQNEFRMLVYRNLQAMFQNNKYSSLNFTKFEGKQKQAQADFIDNVVSPYLGFNVRKEANAIINGNGNLTESQRKAYAERFKQIAEKIRNLPNAQSITNQANNLTNNKEDLQFLIDHKNDLISGKPIDRLKNYMLHISSGRGSRERGEVYLSVSQNDGKYYVVGLPNTEGRILITRNNIDAIIDEYKKGIAQNEAALAKEEKEGKYDTKGNILAVFLNIRNPLEHDYNGSAFPDSYLISAKEGDLEGSHYGDDKLKKPLKIDGNIVSTGYVAARQVRKARQQGNDGVVYKNIRDPFDMTSYGIFGSNQVKSATDNVGTFSTENNDIRYNIDYFRLRNHRKNLLQEIISREPRLTLRKAYALVSKFNREHGTNFGLTRTMRVTDKLASELQLKDAVSNEWRAMDDKQFRGLENFLHQLFPDIKCRVATRESYDNFIRRNNLNVYASSLIVGDTIYLPEDMRNPDVLLEEYLHPLVNILKSQQSNIYTHLLDEAKHTFPVLWSQIQESYVKHSAEQKDSEILTQALSRYFRQDLGKDLDKHNNFKDWCMKFIKFVQNLFGMDELPQFKVNNIGNRVIEVNQLRDIKSLSDLATILNTDGISFVTKDGTTGDAVYHLEETDTNGSKSQVEYIDDAIQTGNWSAESIKAINDLITDIENGEKEYNRFLLRDQQHGYQRGGRIYETASVILGREIERKRKESSDKSGERKETATERRKRWEEEGKQQESIIESWAKANDLWLNDYQDPDGKKADSLESLMESQWDYFDRGSEAIAYMFDDNTVIKTINLSHYDNNLMRALDKIALHNTLSPNTALEVVGFGRDALGHFQIVALQPYIQGQELSDAEFDEFRNQLAAKESEGWYYVDNYKITDLAPYNIKKYFNEATGKDEYFIVDADYQLQADDYQIDNSVTEVTAEESEVKPRFLLKKETWRDRAKEITTRLLPYDLAHEVNNLLEQYMDKAGEGTVYESLANDFFDSKPTTVSHALDKIIAESNDKVIIRLAQLAKAKIGKAGNVVVEYKGNESSLRGRYVQGVSVENGGAIYIYQNATRGTSEQSAKDSMQKTMLHEIIHAITSDTIESNPRLQKEIASIMRQFQDYVDSNNLVPKLYALKNEKEFVAEFMSRPELREAMKRMPSGDVTSGNLWQRFVNWIKKALGFNRRTTLFNDADRVIQDILDNQAIAYYDTDLAEENSNDWYDSSEHPYFLNGIEYYVVDGDIYTIRGRQRVKAHLPEKWQNQILAEDGLNRGIAVEVEHHNKKYVVFNDDRIISRTSYKIMQWGNENGDRRDILASARSMMNPQRNPSSSNNAESDRQSTFTFNNGVIVNAPFQPNAEQVEALNALAEFVDSPDKKVMTLSGYAGTGKTSLMEMFADMMRKKYKSVQFSASTNKAAAVLDSRVNKKDFKARTLNKIFGIAVEVDSNAQSYNARQLINVIKESQFLNYGDTVIIDEASMINEANYDIIMDIADAFGLKIVFVGDQGQLAPVGENKISKVFRDKKINVVTLSKVERTGDNAILKEATRSRNGENFSNESGFNAQGQGVAFISDKHQNEINKVIAHYVKGLKDNSDYFRVLAYTNAAVAKYNGYVRNLLGYHDYVPHIGEPMTGYSNWGYNYRTKEYKFVNSESYKVAEVQAPVTLSKNLLGVSQKIHVDIEAIPVTLVDSAGKTNVFNYIDIKGNAKNRQIATVLANEKQQLFRAAKQMVGRKQKAEMYARIREIEEFLFVNDNIETSDGRLLQSKTIDFGYAMTVHKSQGSTFTHVLIDDVDIAKASLGETGEIMLAPDLAQNESSVDMANAQQIGEGEDIDLGDLSNVEPAKTKEYGDLSTRQRLEYVAVSRATDTATIISDEVKAEHEDSPLNHIGVHNEPVMSEAMRKSIELINTYYQLQKGNVSSTDFTLTKLAPQEHYDGDYSHATVISRNVKSLITDYLNTMFKKADGNPRMSIDEINRKQYGNIGQRQKTEILAELERLKNYFNETYGEGQYLITTVPIRTTGTFNYNGTEATVAGMTDLILVDKYGGIHLYNTRVKTFDIADTAHNGLEGIEFIQNGVRQLLEDGIGTKVEDVHLIWFNQKYPEQSYPGHETGVTYTTDRSTGTVLVTDKSENVENIPLSEYSRWETPHLAEKIKDSIVKIDRKNVLSELGTIKETQQRSGNNENVLTINQNEYTDEFRRVQEESSRMAQGALSEFNRGIRRLSENDKRRMGGVYGRLLSRNGNTSHSVRSLTAQRNGNTFDVIQVNSSLFHDIFEVNRRYLGNGELVDLHDDYSDCKCFITNDGLCGFAIEPDGNLISVFSLWGKDKRGFLYAAKDFIIEQGATHLDAFDSSIQPLRTIYENAFGAKVASSMDYNMEFDHDDIAQNHDKPQVVFMVIGDAANADVIEKHFNKDQYNEASSYQKSYLTSNSESRAIPQSYEGRITPDANTIFVFGSNPEGRHGAGAAKTAREQFGAKYGQGEGLQGNSYAIPTKDLRSKPLYSEDGGRTPVTMYRGYALTENREAYNIEETVGHTAVDYDDTLAGALYFTNSREEAEDYATTRTDKSPEPPTQENPQGRPVNRHYTGDYAKVSKYHIAADARVEHYADIQDYVRNGRNSNADVIILDKGTMWADNKEYIVRNPKVLVYQNMKRSIAPEQIVESIKRMYETARQNPDKQFKVSYDHDLNKTSLNGYTGAEMIRMFKEAGPIPSNVLFSKKWTDRWNEVQANAQPQATNNATTLQQAPVPSQSTVDNSPINIWSTEHNGYESLSNLAQRPFILDGVLIQKLCGTNGVIPSPAMHNALVRYLHEKNEPVQINAVENLFQAMKVFYSDKYLVGNAREARLTDEGKRIFEQILNESPSAAKRDGGRYGIVKELKEADWNSESKSIMEVIARYSFDMNSDAKELLLSTGNRQLTHTQGDRIWREAFPAVLMKIRSEYQRAQSNQDNTAHPKTLKATIAPYAKTVVTAENFNDVKNNVEQNFKSQAHEIADALGLRLNDRDISTNIQSMTNMEGSTVEQVAAQLSYTFDFGNNADIDKVRIFTALMADLGYETQETATTLQYVAEDDVNFNAVEYTVKVNSLKGVLPMLEQFGFTDFTVNNTRKEVTVLISDNDRTAAETANSFGLFIQELINQNNYVARRTTKAQLERLDKAARRTAYADYSGQRALQQLQDGQNQSGQSQTLTELIDVAMSLLSDLQHVEEQQPFALENYMYLTQQETPEVDADWKKPLLKKLDDEINPDKSYEDNASVFETIAKVLSAGTETEAREIMSEEQRRYEKELDNYDKLTTQIDNLYNSDKIELSEVRRIAELAINSISDEITKLQEDADEKNKAFPELKTDLDFTKATRKQIVDAVGINTLLEYAKKLFDPSRFDDLDTMWQAWDIVDNWDAIIELGSDVFILNEGFGINKKFDTDKYETTNEQSVSIGSEMYGDVNATVTDADAVRENGSEQQHWQIESRTIDTVNELISNILVKRAIHDCYLKDENGNVIVGKWGVPERVSVRNAVQSILHWTQKSQNLDDMIAKLEAQVENNRWLESLIEKLKDPAQVDMQSQFYSIFQKPYQLFGIVSVKNGKYVSTIVNSHPAFREIMNRIKVDFQAAMHPLFRGYGESVRVNMDYLGTKESTDNLLDKDKPITLRRALAYLNEIRRDYNAQHGNKVFTKEMAERAVPYLTAACRMLGFYADESLVRSAVMEVESTNADGEKQYNVEVFNKMTNALSFIIKNLDAAVERARIESENPTPDYTGYKPFEFRAENNILSSVTNLIEPVTNKLEDTHNSSVYDSGKMYQSYVTPSFMTLLMNKLTDSKVKANNLEQEFITDFYGKSEWFRTPGSRAGLGWRNEMLKELALNPAAREKFAHKVQLNFNKHNFMRNMTPQEYTLSLFAEYYAEGNEIDKKGRAVSWYKIPMESNKPSAEFIRFWSYRGDTYKDNVVRDLSKMFLQELSRIQTVKMRNKVAGQEGFIENYDVNGRTFCFLPFFNEYLINQGEKTKAGLLQNLEGYDAESDQLLAQEIQKKLNGESIDFDREFNGDTDGNDTQFMKMVKDAIRSHMEQRTKTILDAWEKEGILKEAAKIEHINNAREDVENYLWNNFLMAKNILQVTIGDIAFYKNTEDLQKRLAELHSPGIRGNKYAKYNGVQVSDGYYRTAILKDLRKQLNFQSNLIDNLTEVLNRKILNAPEAEKEGWRVLKDSLVGEHGVYRDVNVTDAQAYSSPTSYRKKAIIFGKWSSEAEAVYQRLLKGEATLSDVRMAFQPLKPFVYGMLEKNLGVEEAPICTVFEPFQAKNSEYLLIMADALLQNEKTSQPNLLRAIYTVMEDSYFTGRVRDAEGNIIKEGTYNNKGIDTIQFESSIKSALQGTIDIAQHWKDIDGEAKARQMIENLIYKRDEQGNITGYEEDTYVQKTDYDNYCIQQEVPEHFRDHEQAHGSQIRMITHSDLDFYYDPNGNLNDDANIVYYEVKEPDGTVKKLNAKQFKEEYEGTIAENINHSYEELVKELHLEGTKKERNLALSKILRREILSSPRYGIDLLLACTVDKEGNFRIPKGDPIQAKRIEQLCNSIIKNRLNKQKIAGGPIVQVTNFGTDRLSVVFKDKVDGGVVMTEDEWNNKLASGEQMPTASDGRVYRTYKQYIHERQGGIAYFECFAPVWTREIFDKFTRTDGTIDVEAIDRLDPDLLKMVGYRIPTEDKYSCAPLKIKGFLPAIAGEAIMLPYELTTINDSDYDVDKEYVMRKVIFINTKKKEQIANAMWRNLKSQNDIAGSLEVKDMIDEFVEKPEELKTKDAFYERLWNEYIKCAYYTVHPKKGTLYRNNKIVDMTYEVLSHETNVMKILNPGGFDNLKAPAYLIEAFRLNVNNDEYAPTEQEIDEIIQRLINETDIRTDSHEFTGEVAKSTARLRYRKAWDALSKMSTDELKKLCATSKDLCWADTEIQFYRQNSAASSLIGVQAVNKVAHAVLEGDGFYIDVDSVCNGEGFTIAGMTFGGMMEVDKTYNNDGNLIGKILGSTVSGAADAVKDPIYNLVNVNMATVNLMNTLLRFGMGEHNVFMFMAQDVISRAVEEYNKANLTGKASFAGVVETLMEQIREKYAMSLSSDSKLFSEELTYDEMIEGLVPGEHPEIDLKVLNMVQKLLAVSDVMRNLDYPTRFNSVTSAAGPHILDNLITEHKINKFTLVGAGEGGTHIYTKNTEGEFEEADFYTVLDKHPILAGFKRGIDVAAELFKDMPAGSDGFRSLLNMLPDDMQDSFCNDKKLLDKLSNFYQTYMLVAAGLLNPGKRGSSGKTEFESYIMGFPKYFIQLVNSEEYKRELDLDNNAFIKAIQPDIDSNSGNLYLKINLTGLDPQMKQPMIDGWVDLYKKGAKGKDLATKLIIYNIYRGGVGFSPKTFTALISTYLKENFSGKDRYGNEVVYRDIFELENFPAMNNERIFDQFVRNNWDDYRLVSYQKKTDKFGIDYSKGELTVRADVKLDGTIDDFLVKQMMPQLYISTDKYVQSKDKDGKTKRVKTTVLWRQELTSDNLLVYKLVKPLGNNGEYLEMDIDDIKEPLTETSEVKSQEDSSTMRESSQAETEVSGTQRTETTSTAQTERNLNTVKDKLISQLIENTQKTGKPLTAEDAEKRLQKIKNQLQTPSGQNLYKSFLHNLLNQAGISVDMDKVIEEFNKYC